MERPVHDGFVDIDITVPDFQVEAAIRVGANPRFVVDICPLATKIRQGHQVSRLAFLALGEIELFHEILLPTEVVFKYTLNSDYWQGLF